VIRFSAGDVRLTILDAGRLWLDGGAMFGVVPKVLWSRLRRPDDSNRIELGMNVLLVEDGERRILIDTGAGTKWDEKGREIYGLETREASEILRPAGLTPDDIDLVVNSHLHFDHAGGNTRQGADGRIEASYPNARYVVQRGELELARVRDERTRASYLSDDFEPLARDDRLWIVDGDTRLTSRVAVRLAPGHTPQMQVPVVEEGSRTVAFLADLTPTASHVPYPYIMGYDLEPRVTLATKKRFLSEAARERWRLVFEHDREIPLAVLEEADGKLQARAIEEGR
jgi:glyoxylase-like metal-dependent hydrolase (beta-lactamase superfamily II)